MGEPKWTDERVNFLVKRIQSSFPKLAGPKFDKLFQTEDNQARLDEFFKQEEKCFLVIGENLKCEHSMPQKMWKGKSLVFMKNGPCVVSAKAYRKELISVEIAGPSAFEQLELISSEIFLPILSNPANQAKWGEVATREIMDRFYSFL